MTDRDDFFGGSSQRREQADEDAKRRAAAKATPSDAKAEHPLTERDAPELIALRIEAKLVEANRSGKMGTFREAPALGFRYSIEVGDGRLPLVVEKNFTGEEVAALAITGDARIEIVDIVREECERSLLEMARRGLEVSKADTIPDALPSSGEPRIPHADRAEIMAKLITESGERMARDHGDSWLVTMLRAEFASVYDDGVGKRR